MGKTLILVSSLPADQEFGSEVASVAGLTLEVLPDPTEAAQKIMSSDVGAVFVDGSTADDFSRFESALKEVAGGLFSDKINANHFHFLSDKDLAQVTYLFESPVFGHFVSRNYGDVKKAGMRYGYIVKASTQNRIFGLEQLLPSQARIQKVRFNRTSQKQEGVEAVKNFLIAAKFKTRMATVIANAVDEIIMNSMFDAPVDAMGKQLYLTTPRSTEIELKDKSLVEMHVGFDREYVAIMAIDLFGSLDKSKLFSHISKRYIEEEYKVKTSVAGAGIGLATIFRSGGSFLFASENSQRTEVTVFFKRTDNFRDFKEQFRFISTQFYF